MSVAPPQTSARGRLPRAIWVLAAGCAFLLILPYVLTPLYRVVDPVSTLMLWRWVKRAPVERVTVPIDLLPPTLPRTVIAAEDARFCSHHGIDFDELRGVLKAETAGVRRPRGRLQRHPAARQKPVPVARAQLCPQGAGISAGAVDRFRDSKAPAARNLSQYRGMGPERGIRRRSRHSPGVRQAGRLPVGLRSGLVGRRAAQSDPARYPTAEPSPAPARRHLHGARGLRNRRRSLCARRALGRIPVRLKHLTSLSGRGRACPGHPDYSCSVPQRSGSPGQARRRRRSVMQRDQNPLWKRRCGMRVVPPAAKVAVLDFLPTR